MTGHRACVRLAADRLVAVSDLHADADALRTALLCSGVCRQDGNDLRWAAAPGTVFAVVGDFIDGPSGATGLWRVARGLRRLEEEAAARGCTVLVLLGNHESDLLSGDWSLCGGRSQLAASLGLDSRGRAQGSSELGAWFASRPLLAVVGGCVLVHGGPTDAWEAWRGRFATGEEALEALLHGHGLAHPLLGGSADSLLCAAARRTLPAFATDPERRARFLQGWGATGPLVVGHHPGLTPAPDLVPLDGGLRHGSGRVRVADLDLATGRVEVADVPVATAA